MGQWHFIVVARTIAIILLGILLIVIMAGCQLRDEPQKLLSSADSNLECANGDQTVVVRTFIVNPNNLSEKEKSDFLSWLNRTGRLN
jgi:hypothetical protein